MTTPTPLLHRLLGRPGGMQRALTWRYMRVTVAALLAIELVLLLALVGLSNHPTLLAQPDARTLAAVRDHVHAHLAPIPADEAGLAAWLHDTRLPVFSLTDAAGDPRPTMYLFPDRAAQTVLVIDADHRIVAMEPANGGPAAGAGGTGKSNRSARFAAGDLFSTAIFPPLPADILASLARLPREPLPSLPQLLAASPETRFRHDRTPTVFLYPDGASGRLALVTPVFDGQRFLGAVIVVTSPVATGPITGGLLALVLASLVVFAFAAGLVGSLIASRTARGLGQRLAALADTTAAWGQGDFARAIGDAAEDEVGQLARHLDDLGHQLQRLLAAREELATTEERNRLARDLHDSVKQQAFAISLNLGSAQLRWDQDPGEARARLDAAADLAAQVQRELGGLIHALRPAPLADRALRDALGQLVDSWSGQTGIGAKCRLEVGDGSDEAEGTGLPRGVDGALYRIAQEGLGNVARHSGATEVTLTLAVADKGVRLEIADNGRGFDDGATATGLGLRSMRERAEALGGAFQVATDPSAGGTRIIVEMPGSLSDQATAAAQTVAVAETQARAEKTKSEEDLT